MNNCIKNESGIYVKLPKENIKFESKEAELIYDLSLENDELQQENKQLKEQLEYLRSGEYINQLKFERNMLEDIVQNMEVSKEDKEFIDMTHRNIELLEENKQLKDRITNAIERLEALIIFWKKYNPIDNTMQVEQFNGVISLLKEDNKEE